MSDNIRTLKATSEEGGGKERLLWLDSCKGVAMMLVVMGHIADGYINAEYFPQHIGILTTVYNLIYSFHMFLFFIISGFAFFSAYMSRFEESKSRYYRQIINIVWVYFAFSIIQWIFKFIFKSNVNRPLTVSNLLFLPIKPMAPYWYLWVLFFLYIIFAVFKIKNISMRNIFGITLLSGIIGSCIKFTLSNDIGNVLYYSFPFCIGIVDAYIGTKYLKEKKLLFLLCTLMSVGIFVYIVVFGIILYNVPILSFISATFISYSIFYLCRMIFLKLNLKLFQIIGRYSLEIYVLHCFITAGNRVLLPKIGINNFFINVVINLIMAITLPILFSYIAKKIHVYKYIFKPASFWKKTYEL